MMGANTCSMCSLVLIYNAGSLKVALTNLLFIRKNKTSALIRVFVFGFFWFFVFLLEEYLHGFESFLLVRWQFFFPENTDGFIEIFAMS